MNCLLDTHFLIWIVAKRRKRLRSFPWLENYIPWGVSPISLLEIQLLAESGRIELRTTSYIKTLRADSRFEIDEAALVTLVEKALDLGWARDPFDRLIAAHSLVRRVRLCSVDATILEKHSLILPELRG